MPPLDEWVVLWDPEWESFKSNPPASTGRRYELDEESKQLAKADGVDPTDQYYTCCFTPSHWMPLPSSPKDDE